MNYTSLRMTPEYAVVHVEGGSAGLVLSHGERLALESTLSRILAGRAPVKTPPPDGYRPAENGSLP